MSTEVTCRDAKTGETETKTITNDWMLVTDGLWEIHVTRHGNGTAVITVKDPRRSRKRQAGVT